MANANQSAFPLQENIAWHRTAVQFAAWVEIIVGVSFILAVNVQSQFIFGTTLAGPGFQLLRFAGIALIGLGIACLPSKLAGTNLSAVRALIIFNIGATIFFAWVALTTTFRGVLLWPVVILHAVITLTLGLSLRQRVFK